MNTYIQKHRVLLLGIGIFAFIALLSIIIYNASILYNRTTALVGDQLRERMGIIAALEVNLFDPHAIDALQVEPDYLKPEWIDISRRLKYILDKDPQIAFAYIVRFSPPGSDTVVQVADGFSEDPYANIDDNPSNDIDVNHDGIVDGLGADQLIWPGFVYDDAPSVNDIRKGYLGVYTQGEVYTDHWGTFFTVYAPIKHVNGAVAGLLALDVRDTNEEKMKQTVLTPFIRLVELLTITLLLLIGTLITLLWRSRAQRVETTQSSPAPPLQP